MMEGDLAKAKTALRAANLRVVGAQRVDGTWGVIFFDPLREHPRILFKLTHVEARARLSLREDASAARRRAIASPDTMPPEHPAHRGP